MTAEFKLEQQAQQIRRVLKDALDPLDFQARVAFMVELLKRLHLEGSPAEHLAQRAARHYEELVPLLVRSLDDFQQRLRSL